MSARYRNLLLIIFCVFALQPIYLLALVAVDYVAPPLRRAANLSSVKIDRSDDTVECVALAIGLEPGARGLANAINAARPLLPPDSARHFSSSNGNRICDALLAASQGDDSLSWLPYPRYWHGYRIIIDPLTAWMELPSVRYLMLVALIAALGWFGFEVRKIAGLPAALALMTPTIILTDLWRIWQFTANCTATIVIFAGGSIFAKTLRHEGRVVATAAVLGSIFNYVDFLVNPPWQPMLIVFVTLVGRRNWRKAITILAAWFFGYATTWASRWAIACAYGTSWSDILGVIQYRLNGDSSAVIHRFLSPSAKMLSFLVHERPVGVFIFAVSLITLLWLQRSRWRDFLLLSWPAAIPFFWFEILNNHTQIHYWFTYRPVASSIGILLAAALVAKTAVSDAPIAVPALELSP